mmetsp:Transcript_23698/g.73518  ORF Transcript_23698/g.73518 Transcript_23698/m.73518 type:complete len:365 (+) Transcript_23698:191-1285(+)
MTLPGLNNFLASMLHTCTGRRPLQRPPGRSLPIRLLKDWFWRPHARTKMSSPYGSKPSGSLHPGPAGSASSSGTGQEPSGRSAWAGSGACSKPQVREERQGSRERLERLRVLVAEVLGRSLSRESTRAARSRRRWPGRSAPRRFSTEARRARIEPVSRSETVPKTVSIVLDRPPVRASAASLMRVAAARSVEAGIAATSAESRSRERVAWSSLSARAATLHAIGTSQSRESRKDPGLSHTCTAGWDRGGVSEEASPRRGSGGVCVATEHNPPPGTGPVCLISSGSQSSDSRSARLTRSGRPRAAGDAEGAPREDGAVVQEAGHQTLREAADQGSLRKAGSGMLLTGECLARSAARCRETARLSS